MAAMTLEELKKGMSDKVYGQIIDIFLRHSDILAVLPFDDCVSASGGGSTMKYKYMRKVPVPLGGICILPPARSQCTHKSWSHPDDLRGR